MSRLPRVVSLLPSATEIVAALGMADCLVGRSHECDFPESVRHLPVVCQPHIDISQSGAEIDRQVKSRLHAGLSIFQVNSERLRELKPDLILTQTQCDVCAVTPQDLAAALVHDGDSEPCVLDLRPTRLEHLFADVHSVATALHVPDRGHDLVIRLRGGLEEIRKQTSIEKRHPTVICLEWFEPLMTAGNWVPELVEIAGGRCLGAQAGEHSPWFHWDALLTANPDVLVLMPCGWDIIRARKESASIVADARWSQLTAVQKRNVFVTDGHQFFNRPGPRLVESAQILAEMLYPKDCHWGHRKKHWEKL